MKKLLFASLLTIFLTGCVKRPLSTSSESTSSPSPSPETQQEAKFVVPSTEHCSEMLPTKEGKVGKYVGFLEDKTKQGLESVVQKNYDGNETTISVVTNMLPNPKYSYLLWLIRDVKGSVCDQVKLGILEKNESGIYLLRMSGPGTFDDAYQVAISDDPKDSKEIQRLILMGPLEIDKTGSKK